MRHLVAVRPPAGQFGTSIKEQRRAWDVYTAALNEPAPADMQVWDEIAPADAFNVPLRIYRSAGLDQAAPAILCMHGGGDMKGNLGNSDSVAWSFA
jgi:acetyl esterase/lipase